MTDDEIMALAIHNVTGAREMQADLIDFARAILAAQIAAPVLTECRHCGFRVALNEAPQGAVE